MASLQCQKSSLQYISHAFIQRRIASINHHLISHVSGFCVASLEVRSCSGSAIKLLIRAFRLERPVQCRIMPKRDLHLVLSALMNPPFTLEVDDRGRISDDIIDLRWQAKKTVLLLALGSARWRSYLHALSVASGWCVLGKGNTQRQKVMSFLPEARFFLGGGVGVGVEGVGVSMALHPLE